MVAQAGVASRSEPLVDSIPGTLVRFEMVPVPGGTVSLPGTDGSREVDVAPFHIGRTEVSWDMYDVFALGLDAASERQGADAVARPSSPYGAPDYGWGHAGFPVISVTRAAAEAFCVWLSTVTGRRYRLPTEAEWMRAASLSLGTARIERPRVDALAWHGRNSEGRTHAIASRQPDALGLFDLLGNAAEWVTTEGGEAAVRGGSFRDPADGLGLHAREIQHEAWTERDPQLPKSRWWLSDAPFVGFRIVRDP